MADNRIAVQLARPERKYVKVYHDFLDNSLLSAEEQMIFIVLKSFIDFKDDNGEAFPSMETICKRAKMSEKRARKNINALVKKGVVKKIRRGLTKTNLYIISDYENIWTAETLEDMAAAAESDGLTADEHIEALRRMGYEVSVQKTNEPITAATQSTVIDPLNNNKDHSVNADDSTDMEQSQYKDMEAVKNKYEYSDLILRYPEKKTDIDIVIDIIHRTFNSPKEMLRVDKSTIPKNAVIDKLEKLEPDDLIFVIDRYHKQTYRIKNPKAWLLTALFNAPGQAHLDIINLGHHNGDF